MTQTADEAIEKATSAMQRALVVGAALLRAKAQLARRGAGRGPPRRAKKGLIERAYRIGEVLGLQVWCADEAGPYQAIPHPGESWQHRQGVEALEALRRGAVPPDLGASQRHALHVHLDSGTTIKEKRP
jgi:hypothetical protein